MAKNNCRKGFVEIPQMTLNTLKGLLFDNEGVDLSNIINDLKPNENDELTAINVGLVHKGLTPEIDKSARYVREWNSLIKWEYVGISLILGVVKVKRYTKSFDTSNHEISNEWKENDGVCCYGFDQWIDATTKESDIIDELKKTYPLKNSDGNAI